MVMPCPRIGRLAVGSMFYLRRGSCVTGRNAHEEAPRRHIPCDDGAGGDHRAAPHPDPRKEDRVGGNHGVVFDNRADLDGRWRVWVIGERDAGEQPYTVVKGSGPADENAALCANVVAHRPSTLMFAACAELKPGTCSNPVARDRAVTRAKAGAKCAPCVEHGEGPNPGAFSNSKRSVPGTRCGMPELTMTVHDAVVSQLYAVV